MTKPLLISHVSINLVILYTQSGMYLVEKEKNIKPKLKDMIFSELKLREREHLQKWIANNSYSLREELLIIQKEVSEFNEPNERLVSFPHSIL